MCDRERGGMDDRTGKTDLEFPVQHPKLPNPATSIPQPLEIHLRRMRAYLATSAGSWFFEAAPSLMDRHLAAKLREQSVSVTL